VMACVPVQVLRVFDMLNMFGMRQSHLSYGWKLQCLLQSQGIRESAVKIQSFIRVRCNQEMALHQFKYSVSQFPNGISTLSLEVVSTNLNLKGKNTMSESYQSQTVAGHKYRILFMCIEQTTGRRIVTFGDAGFAVSRYFHAIIRNKEFTSQHRHKKLQQHHVENQNLH
jgi:hypothetical protein